MIASLMSIFIYNLFYPCEFELLMKYLHYVFIIETYSKVGMKLN